MFQGSIPALVTPMRDDGAIDFVAWQALLEFHLREGTDGVVVGGTTGESPVLDRGELEELVRRAKAQVAGRMPVIAGSGTNGTAKSVALSRAAEAAGADALLVVTPYYNKPTQEGLYRHFMAVADAVGIPVILYNVPGRTACDMQAGTVVRSAAWVLLAVAPVYSMFFVSADLQGSRYLYLSACGWAILLSVLLLDSSRAAPARLGLLMTAALALVWAGGTRLHLADWEGASRLRDRVLASADSQLRRTDCGVVHFTGIPDSVGGAYVFRNGFLEAIGAAATAGAGATGSPDKPLLPACTVEWHDDAFRHAAADGGGPPGTRWSAPSRSRR